MLQKWYSRPSTLMVSVVSILIEHVGPKPSNKALRFVSSLGRENGVFGLSLGS